MNSQERFENIYNNIKDETELHWYNKEASPILQQTVKGFTGTKTALDLGCGTGLNSIFLAKQGFQVTGLDFVQTAIDIATQKALKENVEVTFSRANVLTWKTNEKFGLILDSGCLHTISDDKRAEYKKQLLKWFTPNSVYILFHFAKEKYPDITHAGPSPKTFEEIEEFLSPELILNELKEFNNGKGPRPINQYVFVWQKK